MACFSYALNDLQAWLLPKDAAATGSPAQRMRKDLTLHAPACSGVQAGRAAGVSGHRLCNASTQPHECDCGRCGRWQAAPAGAAELRQLPKVHPGAQMLSLPLHGRMRLGTRKHHGFIGWLLMLCVQPLQYLVTACRTRCPSSHVPCPWP